MEIIVLNCYLQRQTTGLIGNVKTPNPYRLSYDFDLCWKFLYTYCLSPANAVFKTQQPKPFCFPHELSVCRLRMLVRIRCACNTCSNRHRSRVRCKHTGLGDSSNLWCKFAVSHLQDMFDILRIRVPTAPPPETRTLKYLFNNIFSFIYSIFFLSCDCVS